MFSLFLHVRLTFVFEQNESMSAEKQKSACQKQLLELIAVYEGVSEEWEVPKTAVPVMMYYYDALIASFTATQTEIGQLMVSFSIFIILSLSLTHHTPHTPHTQHITHTTHTRTRASQFCLFMVAYFVTFFACVCVFVLRPDA